MLYHTPNVFIELKSFIRRAFLYFYSAFSPFLHLLCLFFFYSIIIIIIHSYKRYSLHVHIKVSKMSQTFCLNSSYSSIRFNCFLLLFYVYYLPFKLWDWFLPRESATDTFHFIHLELNKQWLFLFPFHFNDFWRVFRGKIIHIDIINSNRIGRRI